jgi:tetratricopeptide (TPR) repeat protein
VHHPIKTSSSEAQKFFDQGVALTFGFNHEAAIRSFERAQQIDPKAAMAYWGEAWALGTNYNMSVDDPREKLAFDKISQARTLAADGPQIERDYIDAMSRRYSADMKADRAALERKYSAAMRAAMDLSAVVLDARVAWARGAHDIAIQLWRRAVASEDKLPYDEPPTWYYPMRESLGAALLMAGKPADAERVFREDLLRNPRNARSLFGLQAALEKQGKDADAAWIAREFEEAWRDADTKLSIDGL